MILVNLFKVQSADVVSLRDTNTCGAVDPGLRRDDEKKKSKEKHVIPRLDRGTQVIRALCASTDNLLSLRA